MIDFNKLGPPFANVKGHILRLKTNHIVVPFEAKNDGWYCIVVKGEGAYPVGGYNIFVFHNQLLEAERILLP